MTEPPARPTWRIVLALAVPALVQQYLFFVIQQYDQYLAGAYSSVHRAALTNANYWYWLFSNYSVVVSAGATALVGRFFGAGDILLANRAAGQSILLAAAFGSLASAFGLLFTPFVVGGLGLSVEARPVAEQFLVPLCGVMVLQLVETAGIACLIGTGDTRTGLYVLAGVAAVNVPVAYTLSRGAGIIEPLGFVGIAWGTAASHAIGCVAVLAFLFRGRSGLKLSTKLLVPDIDLIRRLLRVSLPAAADSMSIGVCQMWFLRMVNGVGTAAVAGHGIAIRWEGLGYLAGGAFGVAASSIVSRGLGAGKPAEAARGAWTAFGLAAGVMTFMGGVFFALADVMCRAYSDDPEEVRNGVVALRTVAFAMPALAAVNVFTSALRGAGDTRVPVLFGLFGFLAVRIPLAYYLIGPAWNLGLWGAWLAMFADLWVRGLLFFWRFAGGKWTRVKV